MEKTLAELSNNNQAPAYDLMNNKEIARAMQEVQVTMLTAKRFPRNRILSEKNILEECSRYDLAISAFYKYKRGNTEVSGLTIHIARMMAQQWGNLKHGLRILEQNNEESRVEAYAWDLETNYMPTLEFVVKHVRELKGGKSYPLTSYRDISELIKNYGARNVRSCIFQVIPKSIIAKAETRLNKALLSGDKGMSLKDGVIRMLSAFKDLGVSEQMIEKKLGFKIDVIAPKDLTELLKSYNSIKDGMMSREEVFEMEKPESMQSKKLVDLTKKAKQDTTEKK